MAGSRVARCHQPILDAAISVMLASGMSKPHPPKNVKAVTIYLTPEQIRKVSDVAKQLTKRRKATGSATPVSKADIIRVLITSFLDQVPKHYPV